MKLYCLLGLVWGACAVLAYEAVKAPELEPHSDEERAAWLSYCLGEVW